ncbi:MAG: DUF5640 domain-containing protein [Oscillospiraceae bacterium]|nr:DUF5640 domain-containing protein [Oscillospiraceae bacterium]
MILSAIALCLAGCGQSAIVGTWITEIDGTEASFEFTRDNKIIASAANDEGEKILVYEGSYQLNGDKLKLIPDDPQHKEEEYTFQINGDKLILTMNEDPDNLYQQAKTIVLSRAK